MLDIFFCISWLQDNTRTLIKQKLLLTIFILILLLCIYFIKLAYYGMIQEITLMAAPTPTPRYFWILRVAKFRLMEVNSTLLYIYKFPLKDTASLYIQIN